MCLNNQGWHLIRVNDVIKAALLAAISLIAYKFSAALIFFKLAQFFTDPITLPRIILSYEEVWS